MKVRRFVQVGIAISLVIAVFGCKSNSDKVYVPKVNPEFLELTKEELFAKGEALFENEKWSKSREYYTYVYENYPNDPLASRSLLRLADTYFKQGGDVNLVEAQYKYRDFINRFPTSDRADYAMLQIANVAYEQMEKPDRDQTKTTEAIQKYRELLQLYPGTPFREEAEQRLGEALDNLAKHELLVAEFYIKRRDYKAAMPRLEGILDIFPSYAEMDRVFYQLGVALAGVGREGEARLYFERVLAEFPESDSAKDARTELSKIES